MIYNTTTAAQFSRNYLLHGVWLNLESNAKHIPEVLDQVLYPFNCISPNPACPRIQFQICEQAQIDQDIIQSLKPVSFSGESTYYADTSGPGLFIHSPDKFFSRLDLNQSCAVCYVHPDYARSQWFIFHQVFYPALAELLKGRQIFNLHAAVLAKGEQGIIFPAQAGSGKSTLSINLLRHGFNFLSDDICFVVQTPDGLRLMGFPEPIQIWENTADFFPDLKLDFQPDESCHRIKKSFRVEDAFPGVVRFQAVPRFLIIPEIIPAPDSHLEPLSKTEALTRLIPQSLLVANRKIVHQHLDILTNLVDVCDCHRLSAGRDPEQIPLLINRLFQL